MQCFLFPMVFGLFSVSTNFTAWFFGQGYEKVAILLKISSIMIVFMCVGNFVGVQYLSPTGKQNKMTMAYIIAALTNIALNFLLIPKYYSVGALIASVIAEAVSCFIQVILIYKSDYKFNMFSNSWKYLASAIIMLCSIVVLDIAIDYNGIMQTFSEIIVGMCFYFIILIILKEQNVVLILNRAMNKIRK